MDEREKFYIEQKVKLNTEVLKVLSLVEIATITGILSLILTTEPLDSVSDLRLVVLGGSVFVVLLFLIFFVYRDNIKLINRARNDR